MLGSYIYRCGKERDLAGDAGDVCYDPGFLLGEEVRNSHLRDADGVRDVDIDEGIAGG